MTDDDHDFMTMKSHKIRKDAYNKGFHDGYSKGYDEVYLNNTRALSILLIFVSFALVVVATLK